MTDAVPCVLKIRWAGRGLEEYPFPDAASARLRLDAWLRVAGAEIESWELWTAPRPALLDSSDPKE